MKNEGGGQSPTLIFYQSVKFVRRKSYRTVNITQILILHLPVDNLCAIISTTTTEYENAPGRESESVSQ